MPQRSQILPVLFAVLLALGAAPLAAKDDSEASLLDFVVGDYAIVGREPDGGAAYRGSASIEPADGGVTLKERRDGHELTAAGQVEAPSPGEGKILRFRWQNPDLMVMTCLVSGDLDNYARLTCYWLREGLDPKQPGLEAMFPTAAWPSPELTVRATRAAQESRVE